MPSDLTVERVGDEVHLHWTTPSRSTDGVTLPGTLAAEICRGPASAPGPAPACAVIAHQTVQPGSTSYVDHLPPTLVAGSTDLLAYRVQLRGPLNKTAGPSNEALTVSGPAPEPVAGLRVTDTRNGAMLEWTRETGMAGDVVELERVVAGAPPPPHQGGPATPAKPGILTGAAASSREAHLTAGAAAESGTTAAADPGGTLDRGAVLGQSYRYTAQRVRSLELGGHALEMRSAPSAEVEVTMRDVFAPEPPTGLVASPGPGSIDLSWEPDAEPRIAGYKVYRRDAAVEGAEWRPMTPTPVTAPAWRDTTVEPGRDYAYRVTAIDTAGHESKPSASLRQQAE